MRKGPFGSPWGNGQQGRGGSLTASIISQVQELVVPLGDNAQSILEEGHDDEESSNRG